MEERDQRAKDLGAKYSVVVEEENGELKVLYLKEPSKEIYKAFFAVYETDPIAAKETVLKTLVINSVSDMEIMDDYKSLLSALSQLSEIMAVKKSTLKTL